MSVEDLLRAVVAPRAGGDADLEARARGEAMAALARSRRRHRVRRIVSVSAATAGIAAAVAFFVLALPGGEDEVRPASAEPVISLLGRPERAVDRIPGDGWRYGVRADLAAVRFGRSTDRLRYYAARTTGPDLVCVIATTNPGGASRGAACNEPQVLRRVGVLTMQRYDGGNPAGLDTGFLVPDGIDRIIVGGRTFAVRDNMATADIAFDNGATAILVGPAAPGIRPDGGPDWPRGSVDGTPSVTVPLGESSAFTNRPTPLASLRLIAPAAAPAGSVIQLRIAGESGLLDRDTVFGIDATLERFEDGRWLPAFQLAFPLSDSEYPPPASPAKPGGNSRRLVAFSGSAPLPVRLPDVAPGRYRISKEVSSTGSGTTERRTLSTEIEITPDPATPPANADTVADRDRLRLIAMGPDGQRVWRRPALPGLPTPAGEGDPMCWVFAGPGHEGSVCLGLRRFERDGGVLFTTTDEDGTRWGYAAVVRRASAVWVEGNRVPITNDVAFFRGFTRDTPKVEVIVPPDDVRVLG